MTNFERFYTIILNIKYLILLYAIIVLALHIIPTGTPVAPDRFYIGELRADYFLHTAIFLPYMVLVWLHLNKRNVTGSIRFKKALLWFTAGVVLAVCAEGLQYYLPHRSFNILDVFANVTGVVLGAAVFVVKGKR